MNFAKFYSFFQKPFFSDRKYIISIWVLLAALSALKQYLRGDYNNYKIFAFVYRHICENLPLYVEYPEQYFDSNHYGPFFSVVIAPFAIFPDYVGIILWNIFNVILLILGVFKLPIREGQKVLLAWIVTNELITALLSVQFNVGLTGLLLLGFSYLEKKQLFKAVFVIIMSFLIKLYGIVLLAYFFFIERKIKFVLYFVVVLFVLLIAPIIFTDFTFLKLCYTEWYHALIYKSNYNENVSDMANISVIGFMKKVFGLKIHIVAAVAFGSAMLGLILLRKTQHESIVYKLLLLANLLLCLVLFNTNVESPTFIIAFVGIAIWFIFAKKTKMTIFLFAFAILLTSLSPTDIFPRYIREEFVKPYALKVLPCILIWIDLTYKLLKQDFSVKINKI